MMGPGGHIWAKFQSSQACGTREAVFPSFRALGGHILGFQGHGGLSHLRATAAEERQTESFSHLSPGRVPPVEGGVFRDSA